ncbi:alpha-L-fucosidase [Spiroplasma endosymbiont of Aspidapion aeneum]|uniref:alpha-L-fucosidase n=1 Tax=Spiroplasma endosymbiont of Aspidapion aeneum TaxID=3066276 RepID=UPI00313D0301
MEEIKRITNFRNLGIGLFIHFGLYNKIAKGEWYYNMYNMSFKSYYELFLENNKINLKLNIKDIVNSAKINGFNYIVFIAKHHDGFCLFDSKKTSKYDITWTIDEIDILKEMIIECKKNNIKILVYYATMDWCWDDMGIKFCKQLDKINHQIQLILQNYPRVDGFWFDGNWSRKNEKWKEEKLYKIIREKNPEAMIINNSGLTNSGKEQNIEVDSITYEQAHLQKINYNNFKRDLAAEACQSFNDHWGYAENDYNYKSVKYLILKFLQARREKANYLLNISIDKNGELLGIEKESLKIFHKWVKKYAYFLFSNYDIVAANEDDFIVQTHDGAIFGFLYNIPSGGHVKIIQNGGKVQNSRNYFLNSKIEFYNNKLIFLDNNEDSTILVNDNILTITPTAFNYGYNTIVRPFQIK